MQLPQKTSQNWLVTIFQSGILESLGWNVMISVTYFKIFQQIVMWKVKVKVMSDSLQPHGQHSPWNSPGQNTRVRSRSLLQGIFLTQGLNPCSLIAQLVKNPPAMQETCLGSILGLGRSRWEGEGYPLHYSGLEHSMDCIVHEVAKSQTWLSLSLSFLCLLHWQMGSLSLVPPGKLFKYKLSVYI